MAQGCLKTAFLSLVLIAYQFHPTCMLIVLRGYQDSNFQFNRSSQGDPTCTNILLLLYHYFENNRHGDSGAT